MKETKQHLNKREHYKNKTITIISILTLVTFFITLSLTVLFIDFKIKESVKESIHKDLRVAEMIIKRKSKEIENYALSLAKKQTIILFLELGITDKSIEYLNKAIKDQTLYNIRLYDKDKVLISSLDTEDSPLAKNRVELNEADKNLLDKNRENDIITTYEKIRINSTLTLLSITSSVAVKSDNETVGFFIIRYVINEKSEIVNEIKHICGSDVQIFTDSQIVSATNKTALPENVYFLLTTTSDNSCDIIYYLIKNEIASYKTIYDIKGKAAGIIGINIKSGKIRNSLIFIISLYGLLIILSTFITILVHKKLINNLLKEVSEEKIQDENLKETGNIKENEIKLETNLETTSKPDSKTDSKCTEQEEIIIKQEEFTVKELKNKQPVKKKLTVFFSDIAGFSSASDYLDEECFTKLLNNYLNAMAEIAIKWNGTIDKIVGDALVIYFEENEKLTHKEQTLNAVKMAIEMKTKIMELKEEWKDNGIDKPLNIRMGINTGYCTMGNFGYNNNYVYSIIGANVNLAGKLEAAAKQDSILISNETYMLIEDKIQCEYAGDLNYKGLKEAIKAYKVTGIIEEPFIKETDFIKITNESVTLKNCVITPDSLTDEKREELIKSLKLAISYTKEIVENR